MLRKVSEQLDDRDVVFRVLERLLNLPQKERKIFMMRNGLLDGKHYTLEEVGREFGVTRERIRQIEAMTLDRLQGYYFVNDH